MRSQPSRLLIAVEYKHSAGKSIEALADSTGRLTAAVTYDEYEE